MNAVTIPYKVAKVNTVDTKTVQVVLVLQE